MSDTTQAAVPAASDREENQPEKRRQYWRLTTFVAWSLIAHLSGGIAWGVPALIAAQAERALELQKKEDAARIAKGAVEAKAHAKEQLVAQTDRQVQQQLKDQVDRLTAALTQEQKDKLWNELKDKLADRTQAYAEALGNAAVSEQDLRNLEAQLQQDLLANLDQALDATSAKDLAQSFLDQVEHQVAPGLASKMSDDVRDRVAKQLRDQADKLVAQQRDAAKRQRDAGTAALKEAQRQLAAATDLAKSDPQDAKKDTAKLKNAADKLAAATKQVASAQEKTPDLGTATKDSLAAANTAVTAAQTSATDAGTTTADASAAPETKTAAREELTKALDAAKQATDSALETIAKADAREEEVREKLKESSEGALKEAAEQAFTEEFTKEAVPRLAAKLEKSFADQLTKNGITDPKLVAETAAKAAELLAKKVPELAKAGGQVTERFSDIAPDAAKPEEGKAAEAKRPAPADLSALDQKLAEGQQQLLATAKDKMGALAKDARHDAAALKLLTGGAGDDDGLDMRERISRMAQGMKDGRMGALGGDSMGALRAGAMARGLLGGSPSSMDLEEYKKTAALIADRGAVQGAQWERSGAAGQASTAAARTDLVPARAAGADNAAAVLATGNTAPYEPAFKTLAFTAVPNLPGNFVIDGRPEKWAGIPALPLKPEYGSDRSPQSMQLGWRADGIYARFTVADPNRTMDKTRIGDFWRGDTVEVWMDCLNAKERYRARHAGQQFWIWPEGSLDDPNLTGGESVVEKKGGGYVPHALGQAELQRASVRTPEGYVVEFRIPAERLVDADFAPGRIIGFNSYVSTKGGTDWYWSAGKEAGTYAQPDTWGDLLLSGSDAKIELTDKPTAGAPALLIPGEPLRLTLTDGDMDLSPAVRDKVMITLKPSHGGQQLMICEETGPATGIFTGSVSTALTIGDDQPGTLGVYEGETVEAVYLDQARANGARNADVRLPLRFGSALIVSLPKTAAR